MLIEGAGSAAEINLREGDIANMGFARAADCPVVLIGDIDRGGIFAQILGTKAALAPDDAATIVGFIVNKFRGDASLFADGMATIAERTGWRAFGLAPFFAAGRAPAGGGRLRPRQREAARRRRRSRSPCRCSPASPISTTSTRCGMEPDVRLVFVRPGEPLPVCRSRHPARQQGDHRRPRAFSARRAGTSISSPMSGAAAACSGSAAAIRCWGDASPIRRGSRDRPARSTASASSTSRRC